MTGFIRSVLISAALAAAMTGSVPLASAQDKGEVVIASFGGRFQDALRKSIFEPFERETGIRLIEKTGVSVAKVAAMAKSGNAEWDTHLALGGEMLVMAKEGWIEKIDYGQIAPEAIAGLPAEEKHEYGVGFLEFGVVVTWNTDSFTPETAPKSWADVWNPEDFPGKRYFSGADQPSKPIELALMADGVAKEDVYPVDLDRAYAMLRKINPDVLKWGTSASQGPQAYLDGEADLGMGGAARLTELIREGAPVAFTWNDAVIEADYWVVPKGAKNYDNAMKFIEYASRPEVVAELTKIIPYSPSNLDALEHLSEELQKDLSSHPENRKNYLRFNPEWWAATDESDVTNLEKNFAMWTRFLSER